MSSNPTNPEQCPNCKGKGEFIFRWTPTDPGNVYWSIRDLCQICGGTGTVQIMHLTAVYKSMSTGKLSYLNHAKEQL